MNFPHIDKLYIHPLVLYNHPIYSILSFHCLSLFMWVILNDTKSIWYHSIEEVADHNILLTADSSDWSRESMAATFTLYGY